MRSSERLEGRAGVAGGGEGKGQNLSHVKQLGHSLGNGAGPKEGEKQGLK